MEHEANLALGGGDEHDGYARRPEDQWFERKSGRVAAKDVARALVGMANAEGGTVVLGYHDGQIDPVPVSRINELRRVAHELTRPTVRARVNQFPAPGQPGDVCIVYTIEPGERVHETSSGECFMRVGDSTLKLNFAQRTELEFDRGAPPFDGTRSEAELEDLDPVLAMDYASAIGAPTIPSMLNARNLVTRDGGLTVAGALLFMRHPQAAYPNAHVRILRYSDAERGTGSRLALVDGGDRRIEGSLAQQVTQAAHVIESWVPKRTALARSGRFEPVPVVPKDAWLEGLVNAVVHRSYSIAGDHIRVEIFPNRVEITSPGRFPGLVDPERPLDIARHARNPRIARVLGDLQIARDMGEGIRRIFEEMRRRGLTDPIYAQSSASVRLVLSGHDSVPEEIRDELSKTARRLLDVLRRAGAPLGTGAIAQAGDVTRPTAIRALKSLRDLDLVVWEGDSANDPRATWRLG